VRHKSLSIRIMALSAIWISLALVATALLLFYYYNQHIKQHYDAHVLMHLEEMVAAASLDERGELILKSRPSDPRFDIPGSGWYYEILHRDKVLVRSRSLEGKALYLDDLSTGPGLSTYEIEGLKDETLRVQTLEIPAGIPGEHLLLIATAPLVPITKDVEDLAEHVVISFIALGFCLVLAVLLQIKLALRPLDNIGKGISLIREGTSNRLAETYPLEIQQLADELNNLIDHNAVLLKRARNQLGNLAHSIKNPLTVIANEARTMDTQQQDLILEQTSDIRESVDHYLSRARVFGTANVLGARSSVKVVAGDLTYALRRIYNDRNLEFDFSGLGPCAFRGESQDLEEMLGNLMDNACKWATHRVIVSCGSRAGRLILKVEDDGPGIPDLHSQKVLERGHRVDDTVQGHGLGLSIVQEIAELYGGRLELSDSDHGGLCAELILPGAGPE
jgi:signal transduction histidine kinase